MHDEHPWVACREWRALAGKCVALAFALTSALSPVALADESDTCDQALIQQLLQRLSALELQVAELRASAARSAGSRPSDLAETSASTSTNSTRSASASADASLAAASVEPAFGDPSEEVSTFPYRSIYLPSRGRLGAWQGGLGKEFQLRTFIDLEWIDSGADGSRQGASTFDSHHVQVFLDSQIRPNLSAHAELEWEHSGDTVEVDQAYLSWALKDSITLELGRFYTPFGIERFVWYSPTNSLVSRPEVMRQIVPGNFYANGVRLAGFLGSERRLNYEVAVSNGLGADALSDRRSSRQNRDNNSNKALSGRIGLAPSPFFEVGTSFHLQDYSADQGITFWGFDIAARRNGFEVRGEWVDAEVERPSIELGDLRQSGWYAQLSYSFTWDRDFLPELILATRYDDIDLDSSRVGNDDQRIWSFGVSLAVYDPFLLKVEYRLASEDGSPRDNDTFLLQAVVDF